LPSAKDDVVLYDKLCSLNNCLTSREVATRLNCHLCTIHRKIWTEDLPAYFDGHRWKFYGPELAEWLKKRSVGKRHAPTVRRLHAERREAAPEGADLKGAPDK
jgi:excisionase family DNA binding protein